MRDTPRFAALELAVAFTRDIDGITEPSEVVRFATAFNDFLIGGGADAPAADSPIETSEAEATPPKSAAKPKAEPKPDPKPESKAETPAKPAAKPKAEPELTAADCSKAVVKLVTKVGRDPAIQWMRANFGSPNVSGLDTAKHSYASVVAKIGEHIASLETSPAE